MHCTHVTYGDILHHTSETRQTQTSPYNADSIGYVLHPVLICSQSSRREQLQKELNFVTLTIGQLQALNKISTPTEREELQSAIMAAMRIFALPGAEYPEMASPMGFSTDSNRGKVGLS